MPSSIRLIYARFTLVTVMLGMSAALSPHGRVAWPATARVLADISQEQSAHTLKHTSVVVLFAENGTWGVIANASLAGIASLEHKVVLFDAGPCFDMALGAYDYTLRTDLRRSTGGEALWCNKLVFLIHRMNDTVVVIGSKHMMFSFAHAAVKAGFPPVLLVHWGGEHVRFNRTGVLLPPLTEACTMRMSFWERSSGNPSELVKVLTPYPNVHNTWVGFARPTYCPYLGLNQPFNRSYGMVYGKWGSTGQIKDIAPAFRNSTLWEALVAQHTLVFLRCPSALVTALGMTNQTWHAWLLQGDIVCLDALPSANEVNYELMLTHAQYVMGLGGPLLSPTPLQALFCRTSVILPPGQHSYISTQTKPPHVFLVRDSQDVMTAVEHIQKECKISSKADVTRRIKVNSCFAEKTLNVLKVFDDYASFPAFASVMTHVEDACRNSQFINV